MNQRHSFCDFTCQHYHNIDNAANRMLIIAATNGLPAITGERYCGLFKVLFEYNTEVKHIITAKVILVSNLVGFTSNCHRFLIVLLALKNPLSFANI
jgi:hypothetical protein